MTEKSAPEINNDRTALVIVDLVNDGNDDNGFFKKVLNFDISMMQKIEPNLVQLVKASKKHNIPVIGVQAIYNFEYIPKAMKERFEAMGIKGGLAPKGAWGSEIIPKIKNLGLDLILVKSHFSAFSPYTFGYQPGNKEIEEYMKLPAKEDAQLKKEGKKTMHDYFRKANSSEIGVTNLDNYLKRKGIDTLIITGASTHVCVDSTVSGASERGYRIFLPIDAVASEDQEKHYVYLHNQGLFKAQLTTTRKLVDNLRKK